MEQKELISIIVPIYKTEKYLERCVYSITDQTYPNIEIILVDDGSPDESGKIADRLATSDTRIKVIHKKNGGLSSARNVGLDIVTGRYVGFVDSDDYISKTMVGNMYRLIKETGADIAVTGRVDKFEQSGKESVNFKGEKEETYTSEQAISRILTADGIDVSVCDKLFNIDLFKDLRFPLGITNEDNAIIFDVFLKAKKVARTDCADYYYFHRENSITTSMNERSLKCIVENSGKNAEIISRHIPSLSTQIIIYQAMSFMIVYREISRKKMQKNPVSDTEKQMFENARSFLLQNYGVLKNQSVLGKVFRMELHFLKFGVYGIAMKFYHLIKRR